MRPLHSAAAGSSVASSAVARSTTSLGVGDRYEFARYFQTDGNPIVIRVLRRERVSVPTGTFDPFVVQPQLATRGIFSQHGHADVWLRADGGHEVLQMKSHLAFGSISLYLTHIVSGASTPTYDGANSLDVGRRSHEDRLWPRDDHP
ncbi:MAG TPA: DUF3108 domain-containing protein [Gemmatimonadaceae bacterium]|jgi:hypothetical protein